jgi:hypothetical protein
MNITMYVFNKSSSKTFYGMTPIEAWTRKPSKSNHGDWLPSFCVHPKGFKHEMSSNNENKIEQKITTKMVIIVKQWWMMKWQYDLRVVASWHDVEEQCDNHARYKYIMR